MQFHRLDRAKDRSFWSVRVNRDIRMIVHRTSGSLLLCYVGHHDDAYAWAERRKLQTHPTTGAAQLVEIRETVRQFIVPKYVDAAPVTAPAGTDVRRDSPKAIALFAEQAESELLGYGVPVEWLPDVRNATEDTLLDVALHLPAEAAEALLALATGGTPHVVRWTGPAADAFEHPDARRRFATITNVDELAAALEYPWNRWTIFLHPAQREVVERRYAGAARVSGSAGTGKTIVALHRAAFLARENPDARILLTTFSEPLANALRIPLRRLLAGQPRLGDQIDVWSIDGIARRLYELNIGEPSIVTAPIIRDMIEQVARRAEKSKFSIDFLLAEWTEVIDVWQIDSWDAYENVARLGRRVRLPAKQRELLWPIFDSVRGVLESSKLITRAAMYRRLTEHFSGVSRRPFDHVIADESQTSTFLSSVSWRLLPVIARTVSSSRAIRASEFSNSPSHGSRWAWTSRVSPEPCESTIGLRSRSVNTRTGCFQPRSRMSMETWKIAVAPYPCSLARSRSSK
jgi:UvrD/REP helicase N-terminal domain